MVLDENEIKKICKTSPIFIVGCQRSGTSFLYKALSDIMGIGFGRDNTFFFGFEKKLKKYGCLSLESNIKKLLNDIERNRLFKKRFNNLKICTDEFIENLEKREYRYVVRTIYAYNAMVQNKRRWGGKTPDYTANIDFLYKLFPDVKIINVVRDGRDVALSLFNVKWGPKDIYAAAKYWKSRISFASTFKNLDNESYMEIKYEDLINDPEESFLRIYSFIKLEDLELMDFSKKVKNILPKIRKNNCGKWKNRLSAKQNKIFEAVAGDLLSKYDYEVVNLNYKEIKFSLFYKLLLFLKDLYLRLLKGYRLELFKKFAFRYKYPKFLE